MRYSPRHRDKDICSWILWLSLILLSFQAAPVMAASVPQTINTPAIEFTGRRFAPKVITTDTIVFTGRRFSPKTITTGSIEFTGRWFSPKTISTPAIIFTGRGETIINMPQMKGALTGQKGKTVDLSRAGKLNIGGMKAMSGETPIGPGGEPGREKGKTPAPKIARTIPPVRIGARLVFKDHKILKTLNKTSGRPFDLVFPLINSGDEKSNPVQYTVTCRVLSRDAKCPAIKKMGTIPSVGARTTGKIELKGLKFKPGLYEIAVSLRSKSIDAKVVKKVRLNITSAVKPGRSQGITPGVGGGKQEGESKDMPQIRQIQPVKPSEETPPKDKELPRLRLNTR